MGSESGFGRGPRGAAVVAGLRAGGLADNRWDKQGRLVRGGLPTVCQGLREGISGDEPDGRREVAAAALRASRVAGRSERGPAPGPPKFSKAWGNLSTGGS